MFGSARLVAEELPLVTCLNCHLNFRGTKAWREHRDAVEDLGWVDTLHDGNWIRCYATDGRYVFRS